MDTGFLNILGVRIHPINIPIVILKINDLIQSGKKGYIILTTVHGIMESQRSLKVKAAYNHSFLTVPDGMPLIYIGKLFGHPKISRCYGPDLMLAVMDASVIKGYTHFLYGGKEGISQELKHVMQSKFPEIKIVDTYTPPFGPLNENEKKYLIERVHHLKPNIIWVGLGAPKQEMFMHEYLPLLDTNLMIGVGAAFDFNTGQIKSAPSWLQKMALEWIYRLAQEPKRLWKRYLLNNPLFLWNFALQTLKIKKYEIEKLK